MTINNYSNLYASLYSLKNYLQANPPGVDQIGLKWQPRHNYYLDNKLRFDYPGVNSDRNFNALDLRKKKFSVISNIEGA